LNFKHLPFTCRFIDFIDVEPLCKHIGAEATIIVPSPTPGEPPIRQIYTLPVIYDPKTKKAISESLAIAEYLDATYPNEDEHRRLMQPGTLGLTRAFAKCIDTLLIPPIAPFLLPGTVPIVSERSKEYFRRTREPYFGGKKLEDVIPKGEEKVVALKKVEDVFNVFAGWHNANPYEQPGELTNGDPWLMGGPEPSYCDLILAGYVIWMKKVWGEESDEWKEASSWNGGRWERLLEGCEIFEGEISTP
jgi:glutathione S-transferase